MDLLSGPMISTWTLIRFIWRVSLLINAATKVTPLQTFRKFVFMSLLDELLNRI